jgi:hypothetical protein
MARLIDLAVVKVHWVTTLTSTSAPSATELNAGTNLGIYLTTNYKVGMEDSDTVSERSVTESAEIQVPTIQKYSGMLELFRDFTAGVPSGSDFTSMFAGASELGYIVRRTGKASSVTFATSDVVELYKFVADPPHLTGGTGSGYVKGTVKLLPQGVFNLKATVA